MWILGLKGLSYTERKEIERKICGHTQKSNSGPPAGPHAGPPAGSPAGPPAQKAGHEPTGPILRPFPDSLGGLTNDDGNDSENVTQKRIRAASKFITLIAILLIF